MSVFDEALVLRATEAGRWLALADTQATTRSFLLTIAREYLHV